MNDTNLTNLCNLFLALSDKTRLRLIGLMAREKVSVGFLVETIGESQPKVSRHLAFFRNIGLVSTERDGKNVFYSIEWPKDQTAYDVMNAVVRNLTPDIEGLEEEPVTVDVGCDEISSGAYMTDYAPNELEVYLL